MSKENIVVTDRKTGQDVHILDIQGEINAFAENELMDAYDYHKAAEKVSAFLAARS